MIVKRCRDPLPVLACLAALVMATDLDAQRRASRASESSQSPVREARKDDVPVLPVDMLPVPGGTFEIGIGPQAILDIENKLFKYSYEQRLSDIRRLMSELGPQRVTVSPFLMARFPVTNAQYKVFVEKTGHRFPYHWWRYGQEADYSSRLKEIQERHATAADPALEYWKQNWSELPWTIPEDEIRRGQKVAMDDYPVVYVSWRDAVAYAAWTGMRLPSEIEWCFAASGGEDKPFLWGEDPDGLKVPRGLRNDRPWPVGHWGDATQGPYGQQDMVLAVWEWTGELGFFSFPVDKKDYTKALEKLFRDKAFKNKANEKVAAVLKFRPGWAGDKVVAKGGMWTSIKTELRIGTRAPIESIQTMSALGFRLAKSPLPARDMSASLIKLDYDYSFFGGARKPNPSDQVGIERYELSPDGKQILGYHAVSIVPVSHASEEKSTNLAKLMAGSVEGNRPFAVGTFITTFELKSPAVGKGIYTLAFRHDGMPDDLRKALPAARKALKAAERTGVEVEAGDWSKALRKYGITDEEALEGDVKFIRLNPGELEVSTEERMWLLRDHKGDYVQAFPASDPIDTRPKYEEGDATVALVTERDGTERIDFRFGVPVDERARGRVYLIKLQIQLPIEAVGGEKWRLPPPKKR